MSDDEKTPDIAPLDDINIEIDDESEPEEVNFYLPQNQGLPPKSKLVAKSNPVFRSSAYSDKIYHKRLSSNEKNPSSAPLSYKTPQRSRQRNKSGVDRLLELRTVKPNNIHSENTPEAPIRIVPTKTPASRRNSRKIPHRRVHRALDTNTDDDSDYYEAESPVPEHNLQRNSSQLIDEHLQEIQIRINGHIKAALRYEKRDRIIGYPVTLLSSFIASTLMMNLSNNDSHNQRAVDVVGFSLSVVSFVLSLSRDYLKYTTKFQAHDISSKLYTNLLRSIEIRLVGTDITLEDKRDMFKDIVDQMSIIEQYELPIPDDINREVRNDIFLPRSVVINHALQNDDIV